MTQALWPVATNGSYWIELVVGNQRIKAMVDSGLVDPRDRVGLEVQPATFDILERTGQLNSMQQRQRRSATGHITATWSGMTTVTMVSPATGQPFGPLVQLHVSRGVSGVQHRVGVVFFHRLNNCKVVWELDQRTWCVQCP